jgi:dTDP-4-amino-4,6-dideoxygalactose transaminase
MASSALATNRSLSEDSQKTTIEQPETEKTLFPFLDLKAQFAGIKDEIFRAITRVVEAQNFILGDEVRAFESETAKYIGTQAAVGCASGSDALLLALWALGIGPGDEVITTPFTFVATAGAIARMGAKPVFIDIRPDSLNLDFNQIEQVITERTRAIIPVHLFGLAADMHAVMGLARAKNLAVIEDAAQAIGARYKNTPVGSFGVFGCFSFFPSKNLGAAGDGGLITTNDKQLAQRLRLLRVHGSRQKYQYEILGMNSRLDSLQAAILRVKLAYLDAWTRGRQQKAAFYKQLFREFELHSAVSLPHVSNDCVHVYNQFVIRCIERDSLREFLQKQGIPTEIYYPKPLHLQPAFTYLSYKQGQLPEAEAASREALALPIYPELTTEHQAEVVRGIAKFYETRRHYY